MNGRGMLIVAACWVGSFVALAAQECVLPEPEVDKPGDWCEWLRSGPGKLYDNEQNAWLSNLTVFGRFHYNLAWVDGESAGRDFWYSNRGEIRRMWLGAHATLAGGALALHHEMMFEDDKHPWRGPRDVAYDSSWATYLEWELTQTFPGLGGGSWWVGYGKRCLPLAEEVLDSSKFMPVVERSALSNRLFVLTENGSSPLGAWVRHHAGRWSTFAGFYSTDTAPYWGNWADGTAWIVQTERDITDWTGTDTALMALAFYNNDTKRGDDRLSGDMNWVGSAWAIIAEGPWTWRANVVYGDGDSTNPLRAGRFWGFVGTAEYWLIDDKLEAVARYLYQGAENPQGVRMDSRYARAAGLPQNENIPLLAGGYGDQQHAFYVGLNWLLCSHQIKLMSGVEWEQMKSGSTDVYKGLTYWLGLRTFF